jgi:hypothetical protein
VRGDEEKRDAKLQWSSYNIAVVNSIWSRLIYVEWQIEIRMFWI